MVFLHLALRATAVRLVRHHCPHRMSVGGPTAVCELHHNEESLPVTEFASSLAACWGTLAHHAKIAAVTAIDSIEPPNPIVAARGSEPKRDAANRSFRGEPAAHAFRRGRRC
jgi:hypothetical protein